MEEIIAAADAARELGLNESTIRQAIRRGALRGQLMGHSWMVERRALEAWMNGSPRRRAKRKTVVTE